MELDRLLLIHVPLEEVLKTLKHDSLSNTEWERLADLQRLLQPFREQTDTLQTDTMSLSAVLPSVMELKLHLQDPSLPKAQSTLLLQSLKARSAIFFLDTPILYSTLYLLLLVCWTLRCLQLCYDMTCRSSSVQQFPTYECCTYRLLFYVVVLFHINKICNLHHLFTTKLVLTEQILPKVVFAHYFKCALFSYRP